MRYGIVENNKFVLLDNDLQRLRDTIPFMPKYTLDQIAGYDDGAVEQGYDGNWYLSGHAPKQPLEEAKAAKLAEINSACDGILKSAVKTYPDTEVMTFDQQVKEAEAYLSDPANPVSLLAALASARGIELSDLAARVMVKHQSYTVLSGKVIGQRQALEDRLSACETTEEVNAIIVAIGVNDE